MKFQYLCDICNHEFSDNEARCDNWRYPSMSFICPNCGTALKKMSAKDLLKSPAFIWPIFLVTFLAPVIVQLMIHISYRNGDVYALLFLVSVIIATRVAAKKFIKQKPFLVKKYE